MVFFIILYRIPAEVRRRSPQLGLFLSLPFSFFTHQSTLALASDLSSSLKPQNPTTSMRLLSFRNAPSINHTIHFKYCECVDICLYVYNVPYLPLLLALSLSVGPLVECSIQAGRTGCCYFCNRLTASSSSWRPNNSRLGNHGLFAISRALLS